MRRFSESGIGGLTGQRHMHTRNMYAVDMYDNNGSAWGVVVDAE